MIKDFPDSAAIRTAARAQLAENNGTLVAVSGFIVSVILPYVINACMQSVTGITTFLVAVQKAAQEGRQPNLPDLFDSLPTLFGELCACVTVEFFLSAVFAYGLAALSIAVIRGGARLGHVFSGFGKGWATLYMMAMAHMYVFFWSLLLVVPGIRAAFSYALIYLVKADHPDWAASRCLDESKRLMTGNRMRYFRLWCSFWGWWLLCFATFGLTMVYAIPYFGVARAAFYEDLLDRDESVGKVMT